MRRIAIIGAGAAAACLLESLTRTVGQPCSLTVLDGAPFLWCGRAYQREGSGVLTNIPAAHMSLRASDPGHALRWLARHAPGAVDDDGLTSRSLYGAYLQDTASCAWRRLAKRGWRLRLVREYAARLLPEGGRVAVATAGGRCEYFDHVVLCTGPVSPVDPYRLAGHPRYVAVPFPLARTLAGVSTDDHVGVLGSGLTALDIVAELVARGHRSAITLASRSGVLPAVRHAPSRHRPRHLTLPGLEDIVATGGPFRTGDLLALLRAELRATGISETDVLRELALSEPALDRLRRQLRGPAPHDAGIGVVREALHHFAGHAWNLLPEHEQAHLWQRYSRAVTSLCCPMPRHRAALLLRLLESGQLRVVRDLSAVVPHPGGTFELVARDSRPRVNTLFNAMNPGAPGTTGGSGPLEASVARRFHAGHRLGGLRTERGTHRVPGAHNGRSGLYALGHPTRGAILFHFGIPSLVHQSGLLAQAIAARTDPDAAPAGAARSARRQSDPGR